MFCKTRLCFELNEAANHFYGSQICPDDDFPIVRTVGKHAAQQHDPVRAVAQYRGQSSPANHAHCSTCQVRPVCSLQRADEHCRRIHRDDDLKGNETGVLRPTSNVHRRNFRRSCPSRVSLLSSPKLKRAVTSHCSGHSRRRLRVKFSSRALSCLPSGQANSFSTHSPINSGAILGSAVCPGAVRGRACSTAANVSRL